MHATLQTCILDGNNAARYGKSYALSWGSAHEIAEPNAEPGDTCMDNRNNSVGAMIGGQYWPGGSPGNDFIANEVMQAVLNSTTQNGPYC